MNQLDRVVIHTFADVERVVRDLCQQIQQVASRLPDEESRTYAEAAKENLWRMYESAHHHALARTGLER
jgi:tRNA G37 N-methylase Trm5